MTEHVYDSTLWFIGTLIVVSIFAWLTIKLGK